MMEDELAIAITEPEKKAALALFEHIRTIDIDSGDIEEDYDLAIGVVKKLIRALEGRPFELKDCTFEVFWSDEDREWVGRCREFPSMSWLDADPLKALAGIRKLVEQEIEEGI